MKVAQVQNLSDTTQKIDREGAGRELGAKVVYGLLTLLVLWAAGDANGEIFWSRQPVVFLVSFLAVGLWLKLAHPLLLDEVLRKPKPEEVRQASIMAFALLALSSLVSGLCVLLLPESPWVSWEFLKSFNVFSTIWALPFIVLSSFVVEIFLRGYLSKSWGRGNLAFLEAVTVAVALQHFIPFLMLLPSIFVFEKLSRKYSICVVALCRALWTLGLVLVLSLLA